MATATSLAQAAGQAYDNLHIHWLADQLKFALTTFWETALDEFPQSQPSNHPVSNWFVLIAALAAPMASANVPIEQLTQAAEFVYRLCWMASSLEDSGGITSTQAAFLLATYNTIIGF